MLHGSLALLLAVASCAVFAGKVELVRYEGEASGAGHGLQKQVLDTSRPLMFLRKHDMARAVRIKGIEDRKIQKVTLQCNGEKLGTSQDEQKISYSLEKDIIVVRAPRGAYDYYGDDVKCSMHVSFDDKPEDTIETEFVLKKTPFYLDKIHAVGEDSSAWTLYVTNPSLRGSELKITAHFKGATCALKDDWSLSGEGGCKEWAAVEKVKHGFKFEVKEEKLEKYETITVQWRNVPFPLTPAVRPFRWLQKDTSLHSTSGEAMSYYGADKKGDMVLTKNLNGKIQFRVSGYQPSNGKDEYSKDHPNFKFTQVCFGKAHYDGEDMVLSGILAHESDPFELRKDCVGEENKANWIDIDTPLFAEGYFFGMKNPLKKEKKDKSKHIGWIFSGAPKIPDRLVEVGDHDLRLNVSVSKVSKNPQKALFGFVRGKFTDRFDKASFALPMKFHTVNAVVPCYADPKDHKPDFKAIRHYAAENEFGQAERRSFLYKVKTMPQVTITCLAGCPLETDLDFKIKYIRKEGEEQKDHFMKRKNPDVRTKQAFDEHVFDFYVFELLGNDRKIKQITLSGNPIDTAEEVIFEVVTAKDKKQVMSLNLGEIIHWPGVMKFWGGVIALFVVFVGQILSCVFMARHNKNQKLKEMEANANDEQVKASVNETQETPK